MEREEEEEVEREEEAVEKEEEEEDDIVDSVQVRVVEKRGENETGKEVSHARVSLLA